MSIFDTYRVVYTAPDGVQDPGALMTRESAIEFFDIEMDGCAPLVGKERVRVISEKVWIESQAVKR